MEDEWKRIRIRIKTAPVLEAQPEASERAPGASIKAARRVLIRIRVLPDSSSWFDVPR
jgi:hypothetical protein